MTPDLSGISQGLFGREPERAFWVCLMVCVTCVWAGVDSVWEQENAEARKMLENTAESHT